MIFTLTITINHRDLIPSRRTIAAGNIERAKHIRDEKTITAENLERLTLQERLASANGFSLAPPIYALGTPVNETGVANFRKSRQEFESLPPAAIVFAPFLNRVASEVRRDVTVRVNELRMSADGRICRPANDPTKMLFLDGARSLRGILERTACDEPGAAATYLATIPVDRRAREVNEWLSRTDDRTKAVLRTRLALAPVEASRIDVRMPASTSTALMIRPEAYGRECYAVVSERYATGMEVDVIARAILESIERGLFPGDARGEVLYDGRRATIRALWHSDVQPEFVCAGEIFKAGMSIDAADDRSGGIDVDGILWRNLCLNLIIIDENHQSFGSRRHMGTTRDLTEWLFEAMRGASKSVAAFAELWSRSRSLRLDAPSVTRDIPADATGDQARIVSGVMRGLVKSERLALPGFRGEAAINALLGSWRREPEFSKVGIVNAITRAAHELPLRSAFGGDVIEAQAGAVLSNARPFQYVEAGEVF